MAVTTAAEPADDRLLLWTVVAIAAHSVAVGLVLVFAGEWGAAFGGWGAVSPRFFVRQFGVFHFAIAAAYLIEYFRYGGVHILIAAKVIAVVSLVAAAGVDGGPWAVPASAAGDAAMAAAVWWLARRRGRERSFR
jgi:hypothetical protein